MPPPTVASTAAALVFAAALQLAAGESLNASWYWQCPQAPPTVPPQFTPYPKACPTSSLFPWCDPTSDVEYRVARLVERLTFAELAAQVSCDIFDGVPGIPALGVNAYNYIRENNHGLLWYGICPVPTLFPQVISMAAAFNETLWTAAGEASAIEVRYNYDMGKQSSLFTQTNFNIAVDPRWGRTQEVPGESPELNAAYAAAWVRGVQAPKGPRGVPLAGTSCKHWTAYSMEGGSGWPTPKMPDSNRHNFNANLSQQDLADTHFPVYEKCAQVGALGMMSSYNAVNGVPMAANGNLTNDIARKKWGFKGTVVTDCGAVEDIWMRHKYVPGPVEAAEAALRGGTDIECGKTIKSNASASVEPLLRTAVTNSFRVRFLLGEFDPPECATPPPPPPLPPVPMYDPAPHAKLAYEAAVQGSVLLKNAAATLPLRTGAKVALLGPLRNGKWEMLGNYAGFWNGADWSDSPNVVSPQEGLQSSPAVGKLVLPPVQPPLCARTDELVAGTGEVTSPPEGADAVVIVAGLMCNDPLMQDPDKRPEVAASCQAGCLESEGCDRPDLLLPRGQRQLIRRAAGWGLPVVLVLISGGPLDVSEFEEDPGVGAILWMGYPGQAAGTALAALLFGQESPSGRLSQTFYRSQYLEKVSIKDMAMRPDAATGYPGRGYRFVESKYVLYPFGHGLSYHQWAFELGAPGASVNKTAKFQTCSMSIKASVSGCPKGSNPQATLLLFFVPPARAHASAPKRVLRHFAAVRGPTGQASFVLDRKDFELANKQGEFRLVEGTWLAELGVPSELQVEVSVSESGCKVGRRSAVAVPGASNSTATNTSEAGKSSRMLAPRGVRGISSAYAAALPGMDSVQLEATGAGGAWFVWTASSKGVLATLGAAVLAAGVLAALARSRTASAHEGAHLLGAEASD